MIVGIDPGVNAIGVAAFGESTRPYRAFVIEPDSKKNKFRALPWDERIEWIMSELVRSSVLEDASLVAVEWPEVRDGVVGHAAAKRGNVSQLAYCCGCVAEIARTLDISFLLVPVSSWKGQLPKPIVQRRLSKITTERDQLGREIETHAWDACGIALHAAGHRLDGKKVSK